LLDETQHTLVPVPLQPFIDCMFHGEKPAASTGSIL
jgi:hypothetical protein